MGIPWPMPLRLRLSVIAVVLVACGLLVAGVATRYELQSFLLDRVDHQLSAAEQPVLGFFARGDTDSGAQQQVLGTLTPHSYAAIISHKNKVLDAQYFGAGAAPKALREAALTASSGLSTSAGYRIDVVEASSANTPADGDENNAGPGPPPTLQPGTRLVIATTLGDVSSTLNRLAVLELFVGLAVLLGVALIAYLLVRRELRSLERIEDTAAAIAAGDLTRRVEASDPETEIGKLAAALNTMLAQIESAFDERRRSEARLRRFVADASHELKTPLTSVRGFAELFRRGASTRPADLATAMSRIESEAARMGVLVDDLLLLARFDEGRPLTQASFDLKAVLAELVSDHELLHPDWPICFDAEGDGHIIGDELRIRQAVTNVLANARAHTPAGTHIVVRLWTEGDERLVEVADDGPGIPHKYLEHIFDRFFRVDPSRARASGGNGLGLSIVSSIAKMHGGRARAFSGEGEGATLRLELPIAGLGDRERLTQPELYGA